MSYSNDDREFPTDIAGALVLRLQLGHCTHECRHALKLNLQPRAQLPVGTITQLVFRRRHADVTYFLARTEMLACAVVSVTSLLAPLPLL
jgi:hypothetical protein